MSVSTHLERAESALRRALINALAEGEDHLLQDLYENLQSVMDLNKKSKNVIRFSDNIDEYYHNKDNDLSQGLHMLLTKRTQTALVEKLLTIIKQT